MPGGKEWGGGFFQSHWLAVLQWTRESLFPTVDTAEARHGIGTPPSFGGYSATFTFLWRWLVCPLWLGQGNQLNPHPHQTGAGLLEEEALNQGFVLNNQQLLLILFLNVLNRKLQSWKHGFQKKVGWMIHQRFVYKWSLWFGATQPKRRRSSCQGRSPREWLSWIIVWLTGLDSTTPNDPFLRVILMGFLWPPQVTRPSFFFSLRQMFAIFCSAGSGTQDFEWNPGLWACQVGTLPLGCIHPQLFSYLSCEHQKWLNTCDQSSKGGAESRGWLGLEVNNSMRSLSIRGAFPMGPWESSHFSLTPGSRPHQRAYAGGSVSWLRWSGGAWHGLTA